MNPEDHDMALFENEGPLRWSQRLGCVTVLIVLAMFALWAFMGFPV